MESRQTIRRVLNEERGLSVFLRRRVPINELEKSFNKAINVAINRHRDKRKYSRYYLGLNNEQDNIRFQEAVIDQMYYNILSYIDSNTLDIVQPYLYDDLTDYYGDRIKEIWVSIK